MPDTQNTYRGIEIVQSDPGMWLWADDVTGAADIAGTEAEARAQIDAHLGPETEDAA